ncbi:hypothetical protein ACRAWF_07550 [Streptomyces sp. L7]
MTTSRPQPACPLVDSALLHDQYHVRRIPEQVDVGDGIALAHHGVGDLADRDCAPTTRPGPGVGRRSGVPARMASSGDRPSCTMWPSSWRFHACGTAPASVPSATFTPRRTASLSRFVAASASRAFFS